MEINLFDSSLCLFQIRKHSYNGSVNGILIFNPRGPSCEYDHMFFLHTLYRQFNKVSINNQLVQGQCSCLVTAENICAFHFLNGRHSPSDCTLFTVDPEEEPELMRILPLGTQRRHQWNPNLECGPREPCHYCWNHYSGPLRDSWGALQTGTQLVHQSTAWTIYGIVRARMSGFSESTATQINDIFQVQVPAHVFLFHQLLLLK